MRRVSNDAPDPRLFPAPGAPRYEALVSAEWVQAALSFQGGGTGSRPPTFEKARIVVLEVSWATLADATEYRAGHIPGALHLNTDDLETGYPQWRLRSIQELREVIGALGISAAATVVVYSHHLIAAARAWWVLLYAGVKDVRLLDGGLDAWLAAGGEAETAITGARPAVFDGPARPELLATTDYVRARLEARDAWLADCRSEDEFEGRASGYSYLDRAGRIPTATHAGDAGAHGGIYEGPGARLRPPVEVAEAWQTAGMVFTSGEPGPSREVVFYCGSGWRSSLAFFYAWLLGHTNIRNYSDGWCGWSTRYVPDPAAAGSTPGWRQEAAGNPTEPPR
jgi:3-mercaptopyruvate sulfurtransferase SseA